MRRTCPEGHQSASTDYCDVCGALLGDAPAEPVAPAASPPAAAPTPAPEPSGLDLAPALQRCPHCGTDNRESNLFCEACGYDFTTGAMPRPVALAEGSFLDLPLPGETTTPPEEDAGDREPSVVHPEPAPQREPEAEPEPTPRGDAPEPAPRREAAPREEAAPQEEAPEPVPQMPAVDAEPRSESVPPEPHRDADRAAARPRYTPPSRALGGAWVVEVWVDPTWYAVQDSEEEAPSPGVPDVVPLSSTSALIGRPSASRNVRPDIDCGSDIGVSRRQAVLTSDGRRWWIEDLDSANGTFVGPAAGPLPASPLPPERRVEVDFDDRIYVGAWTRLVVRRATEAERAGRG